jgi:hypothetical protein
MYPVDQRLSKILSEIRIETARSQRRNRPVRRSRPEPDRPGRRSDPARANRKAA